MKLEKSPTKKVPKRKRILSSDSENEENEGMKGEYEREDPDYEPGSEKYKLPKKISRSLVSVAVDKDKDSNKHTSQSIENEPHSSLNRTKDLDNNLRKIAKIEAKSPRKEEKKSRTTPWKIAFPTVINKINTNQYNIKITIYPANLKIEKTSINTEKNIGRAHIKNMEVYF